MFEKMKMFYEKGLSLAEVSIIFGVSRPTVANIFKRNNYTYRNHIEASQNSVKLKKRIKDISGNRYGRLIVLSLHEVIDGKTIWKCICDCGKVKNIHRYHLTTGNTKSCGCLGRERPHLTKHGESGTKFYRIWEGMKQRCLNSNFKQAKDYAGRGIKICDEWLSYENFAKWAKQAGYRSGLTLDRKDNDGNYEPSNCRFVTHAVNSRNNRLTKLNWEKVNKIRELYKTGDYSHRKLGLVFGVAKSTVCGIVNYRRWKI